MTRGEILERLASSDPSDRAHLFDEANRVRRGVVGEEVHLRGLVEYSSYCERHCAYCGLRKANRALPRYRMSTDEIVRAAIAAEALRCGTLVLQSGDDYRVPADDIARTVTAVRKATTLAVTMSVGERPLDDYRIFRDAGAERCLLKFETSDPVLYRAIKPSHGASLSDRIRLLEKVRRLGFEIGSGIMVGLAGQTMASIADDVSLFAELDLDMVAIGPYIPHPDTPLGAIALQTETPEAIVGRQATTLAVVALARLVCPETNIPSTSALATVDANGYAAGLAAGANVLMPNLTPTAYRMRYSIYPSRSLDPEFDPVRAVEAALSTSGRPIGCGPGGRRHRSAKTHLTDVHGTNQAGVGQRRAGLSP